MRRSGCAMTFLSRELGAGGDLWWITKTGERWTNTDFDPFLDHLLLIDRTTQQTVGVYRLMRRDMADRAGGFYSENEYDLTALKSSGREILELGRSCLHPSYRGGMAMFHLWAGLASYVAEHGIEMLFGVASFPWHPGRSIGAALVAAASHLPRAARGSARHRLAKGTQYQEMNLIPADILNRRQTAMVADAQP